MITKLNLPSSNKRHFMFVVILPFLCMSGCLESPRGSPELPEFLLEPVQAADRVVVIDNGNSIELPNLVTWADWERIVDVASFEVGDKSTRFPTLSSYDGSEILLLCEDERSRVLLNDGNAHYVAKIAEKSAKNSKVKIVLSRGNLVNIK